MSNQNKYTKPKKEVSVQQIITKATIKEKYTTQDQMDTNACNNSTEKLGLV